MQPNPQSNDEYPGDKACCYCSYCCCCCCCRITLRNMASIICIYDIVVWGSTIINFLVALSSAGGSEWMPGHQAKYLSLLSLAGSSCSALGAITTLGSSMSRKYVGNRYLYLKIIGVCLYQLANIISVATLKQVRPTEGVEVAGYVIAIILWVLLDFLFLMMLRSYSLEPLRPAPYFGGSYPGQPYAPSAGQYPPPTISYPGGPAPMNTPYGAPPNMYPVGVPVAGGPSNPAPYMPSYGQAPQQYPPMNQAGYPPGYAPAYPPPYSGQVGAPGGYPNLNPNPDPYPPHPKAAP
jgi:hypothetical protein